MAEMRRIEDEFNCPSCGTHIKREVGVFTDQALRGEIAKLRAALGPLAREADNWTDDVDGHTRILLTLELCRKARSALQSR